MTRAGRPVNLHTGRIILAAYDACRLHGTFRKAGIHLWLSHERVRQLVRQAPAHGTIVAFLKQYGSMAAISRAVGYPLFRLRDQTRALRFSTSALRRFSRDHCKYVVTIRRYDEVSAHFGTLPSCTQLQAFQEGGNVDSFIRRYWGSVQTFRRTYGIVVHPPWTPPSERRLRAAA